MPKHRAGGNITRSHTTVTDAAAKVVDALRRLGSVTKITLGPIQSVVSKNVRVKLTEEVVGWKVMVHGRRSHQVLYVHTSDKAAVKGLLERLFEP